MRPSGVFDLIPSRTARKLGTMKYLAWLVALVIITAGVVGLIAPDRVMNLRGLVATQTGLLAIAAIRIAIGLVLIRTAPATRARKTLKVCGALLLFTGLMTPLFGVERTRAVLQWETAQGPLLMRAGAVIAIALGSLLAFALATPGRRERIE